MWLRNHKERTTMDMWKLIWIAALVIAIGGFTYVSFTVIIRGLSEVRSLLKDTMEI
jgi:hypothetical protein